MSSCLSTGAGWLEPREEKLERNHHRRAGHPHRLRAHHRRCYYRLAR